MFYILQIVVDNIFRIFVDVAFLCGLTFGVTCILRRENYDFIFI